MDFASSGMAAHRVLSGMAARSEISPARWRRPFLDWMDGIEAGWAIPLLLIGFIAVWFVFLVIAYLGGDLHSDVLETWTFGRSIEWGYSKHPPLMGWVARAWTSVFPLTNWSFQLMTLINAAIALWAVDLISRRFVRGDKRLAVLLLLMLLPVYQFHAQRFNANTALLASWPLATWCFLQSFETREIRWAVAAGVAAALAMLGKYYSVFLIVSFAVAALCHPERRAYFRSWTPWVSIATGLAVLMPHLQWLLETGAPPFAYALARHTGKAFFPSLLEAVLFILGVAMILAIPAVTWALMAGDRVKQLSQDFLALNSGLLLLFLIGAGTIAFPAITSVALGSDMPPIWALQGLFLFVIVMVCGTSFPVERFYSVNLAVLVFGIAVAAVFVAAPVHAFYRNVHPLHEGRNFYSLAAEELTRRWHERSDAALAAVGGDDSLAFATAFYSPDHPSYEARLVHPNAQALPSETAFSHGWAALCFDEDAACIAAMDGTAARAHRFVRSEFVVQSTLLGQPGASQGFTALMVPPADEDKAAPPPEPGIAQDSSQESSQDSSKDPSTGAAVLARQDLPPMICCASTPYPDRAESESASEFSLRPTLPAGDGDIKRARRASPAAARPANWPDRAASSASRDGFARWPIPTPNLPASGPAPGPRATASTVNHASGRRTTFCSGLSGRPGSTRSEPSATEPLSVRLKRRLCALAADFDARMKSGAAREGVNRKQPLRRKDGVPDSQRRGI
jgi:4-amino-4-deoxy-L-arabinose transferase-like glycosyltransferase